MLIAGIAPAAADLRDILSTRFSVDIATTLEAAQRLLETGSPYDVLVVGYHFDGFRPYRLIQSVAADHPEIRIVLVRAMPLALPHEDDGAIREAYQAMGVSEYLVLDTDDRQTVQARLVAAIAALLGPGKSLHDDS